MYWSESSFHFWTKFADVIKEGVLLFIFKGDVRGLDIGVEYRYLLIVPSAYVNHSQYFRQVVVCTEQV